MWYRGRPLLRGFRFCHIFVKSEYKMKNNEEMEGNNKDKAATC